MAKKEVKGYLTPNKLTDAQKKQRGTFDARYSEELSLQVDRVEIGAAPEGFTPNQIKAWELHAEIINPLQVYSVADGILFREMVILYATMQEAYIQFVAEPVVTSITGVQKVNPSHDIYKSSFDRWLELAKEFGMGPRARNKFMMPMTREEMRQTEGKAKLQRFLETKPKV